MKKEDAIKYLQQLYPNGGHCWLDEQRIEAISMAIKVLQEEPVNIWHNASENPKEEEHLMCVYKDNRYHIGKVYKDEFDRLLVSDNKNIIELCMFEKWVYIDDILNLSNVKLPKEIEL